MFYLNAVYRFLLFAGKVAVAQAEKQANVAARGVRMPRQDISSGDYDTDPWAEDAAAEMAQVPR